MTILRANQAHIFMIFMNTGKILLFIKIFLNKHNRQDEWNTLQSNETEGSGSIYDMIMCQPENRIGFLSNFKIQDVDEGQHSNTCLTCAKSYTIGP